MRIKIHRASIQPKDLKLNSSIGNDDTIELVDEPAAPAVVDLMGYLNKIPKRKGEAWPATARIPLIKLVYTLTGTGLKEAKEWVEAYTAFKTQ